MPNHIKRNPRAHNNTSKTKGFDPMHYALKVIRKYFDGKAYLTHSRVNGQPIIKYRLVTGRKEVVGVGDHARLVEFSYDKEFTSTAARTMCEELGLC